MANHGILVTTHSYEVTSDIGEGGGAADQTLGALTNIHFGLQVRASVCSTETDQRPKNMRLHTPIADVNYAPGVVQRFA